MELLILFPVLIYERGKHNILGLKTPKLELKPFKGDGKALFRLKNKCFGNKLSKALKMFCPNFLIMTFTINDMFLVHFF